MHELTSEVNSRNEVRDEDRDQLGWLHVMKEDQDLSTRVYGRSSTRDKLQCGCKEDAQTRIDMLLLVRTTQAIKCNKQEHGYIMLPEKWKNS